MPTIDTLKQRELVSNVFLELNDYSCNKALEFNDNVQSTDVDNADRGTLDDLIRNGELSLSLMRLAKFTQADKKKVQAYLEVQILFLKRNIKIQKEMNKLKAQYEHQKKRE